MHLQFYKDNFEEEKVIRWANDIKLISDSPVQRYIMLYICRSTKLFKYSKPSV